MTSFWSKEMKRKTKFKTLKKKKRYNFFFNISLEKCSQNVPHILRFLWARQETEK